MDILSTVSTGTADQAEMLIYRSNNILLGGNHEKEPAKEN